MRKILLSLLFVALFISSGFSQAKNVPSVVLIGIGAKNPTFDESNFKDFKFYYTPGLINQVNADGKADNKAVKGALTAFGGKSAKATYLGEPKILEEMWDKKEMRYHALLYGKNGIACWEGYLDPFKDVTDAKGFDDASLKDVLKDFVGKEKVVDAEASGEIKILDANSLKRGKYYSYPLAERKMPAFNVVDVSGAEVPIKSITEAGAPVLVIFFELPSDIDLKAAKEGNKPTMSQMLQAGGGKVTQALEKMHNQLFGK